LRQCQGIIRLAEKYGHQRLNAACQRALDHNDPAYKTIRTILHDGMECASSPPSAGDQATRTEASAYLHGPTQLFNPQSLANLKEDTHGSGTSPAV
jgi:hypothetical protein